MTPLFFRYRDVIFGHGFVATVYTTGRAICVREDDEFVMAGVEPGGMAASGSDRSAAQLAFRRMYTTILFDIAADAGTFEVFRTAVEGFVHQTSPATLQEWARAVAIETRPAEAEAAVPTERADARATVSITHVELAPGQNIIDEPEVLVAKALA